MSVDKRDYISRLQTLLVFLILNNTAKVKLAILAFLYCTAKVKLAILAFLYCTEIVKNSITTKHLIHHALVEFLIHKLP